MQNPKYGALSADGEHQFLSESFDRRMLLDMEAALDRASKRLPDAQNNHSSRTFIATKIIECVVSGNHSEDAMMRAAFEAVKEWATCHVIPQPEPPTSRTPGSLALTGRASDTIIDRNGASASG